MDVVDAFNHDDCSATEIDTFPVCPQGSFSSFVSEDAIRAIGVDVSRICQMLV